MISIIKIHNSFSVFDKRHLIHHLSFFVPYHMFDICTYGVRRVRARTFSLRCARTRREQRGDGHSRMIDVHGRERVFDRSSRFLLQSLYSHSASTTFVLSVKLLKRKGGGGQKKKTNRSTLRDSTDARTSNTKAAKDATRPFATVSRTCIYI